MPALNFKAEFADDVEDRIKLRSIRKRRKDGRDPKPGDRLHLYTGMRQKGCRKLGEADCMRVRPVEIDHMGVTLDGRRLYCGTAPAFEGSVNPDGYDSDFARADGFSDFQEMKDWFDHQHGLPFSGLLIEWR